jgi:hypothetical protein
MMNTSKSLWYRRSSFLCIIALLVGVEGGCGGGVLTAGMIGFDLNQLKSTVKQAEDSGHSLIDHGNVALGQQQLLLAGTLNGGIDRFQKAYQSSMHKTFNEVDITEKNTFDQLTDLSNKALHMESQTSQDAQNLVLTSQTTVNQILDRLPLTDKSPVFFGFVTRDVLNSFDASPADVQIMGYHLVDDSIGRKKPFVEIAGHVIPEDHVDPQYDRIKVTLPPEILKQLRVGNEPCDPMQPFEIRVIVYSKSASFFKSLFRFPDEAHYDGHASPGKRRYSISLIADGETSQEIQVAQAKDVYSGQVNVDCESTGSTGVNWQAPVGSNQVNATADWVNTDKVGQQSPNAAASGLNATATGSIRGQNKNWLGNCDGGGHGTLHMHVTYTIPQQQTQPLNSASESVLMAPDSVKFTVPVAENNKWHSVRITVKRAGCANDFDSIQLNVPDNPNQNVDQSSTHGYFVLKYALGTITVSSTPQLPE